MKRNASLSAVITSREKPRRVRPTTFGPMIFIPPSTMSQSMNGGTSWRIFVMPPTIAWRPIEQN